MTRLVSLLVVAHLFASTVIAVAQPTSAPDPKGEATREYTVVAGDSCLSIAKRQIGTTTGLDDLHRLNPQLGTATPHRLVPGQKLRLPARAQASADANLTATRGNVAVRRPQEEAWGQAQRGMDLFRAWRVGARERASAEVTFRDSSQLRLRENTVIVIYGPSVPRQPVVAVRAEIEGGTLETRLAQASGPPPSVLTPSAVATLGRGAALVSVDSAGTSLVANHAGDPIAVRAVTPQRTPRGAAVRVQSGMGSRVERGKLPEPPRPLPAAPTLELPALVVPTFAAAAAVPVAWRPVAGAIRYRAIVLDDTGAEQNAVLVPPGETQLVLAEVPPGAVRILLSAIDAAGFEGPPATLSVRVVPIAVSAPGSDATVPATEGKILLGARLQESQGVRCTLTPVTPAGPADAPADDVARRAGPHLARCDQGAGAVAVPIEVIGVQARVATSPLLSRTESSNVAINVEGAGPGVRAVSGAGLLIESQTWLGGTLTLRLRASATAAGSETVRLVAGDVELAALSFDVAAATTTTTSPPPASRAPAWAFDFGGAAGLILPADGSALGAPEAARDRLASGAILAATVAARPASTQALAVRAELAAGSLSSVGTGESTTLLAPSVALGARALAAGPLELWAFGGAGAAALVAAPGTLDDTLSLSLHGGAGVAIRRAGLVFELSAQLGWMEPTGASEIWPSFRVGIAASPR